MSQEEIGNVIGTKRSGVSNIENGIRNVTEKHIKLLCYGPINGQYINENWLRTGEGGDENMFLKPQKTISFPEQLLYLEKKILSLKPLWKHTAA